MYPICVVSLVTIFYLDKVVSSPFKKPHIIGLVLGSVTPF